MSVSTLVVVSASSSCLLVAGTLKCAANVLGTHGLALARLCPTLQILRVSYATPVSCLALLSCISHHVWNVFVNTVAPCHVQAPPWYNNRPWHCTHGLSFPHKALHPCVMHQSPCLSQLCCFRSTVLHPSPILVQYHLTTQGVAPLCVKPPHCIRHCALVPLSRGVTALCPVPLWPWLTFHHLSWIPCVGASKACPCALPMLRPRISGPLQLAQARAAWHYPVPAHAAPPVITIPLIWCIQPLIPPSFSPGALMGARCLPMRPLALCHQSQGGNRLLLYT